MGVADQIQDQMDYAQRNAQDALSEAMEMNRALTQAISKLSAAPRIGYATVFTPTAGAEVSPSDKPGDLQLDGINDGPQLPSFIPASIAGPIDVGFKDFLKSAPDVNLPSRPSAGNFDTPEAPTFEKPTLPDAPEYTMPEAPALSEVQIPDMPEFTKVEEFTAEEPEFQHRPEIPGMVYQEDEYQSDVQEAVKAWIEYQIANGGTGLAPEVEQAIHDRAVTREVEAARENIEKSADTFAASGFGRPPGALLARQDAIRSELQNRIDDLNKDVFINQAKLAQGNTHFAIEQALQYENMALNHFNAVANRAFELAKYKVTIAIETYNAYARDYELRVEAYKAKASVHEMLVRAAALEVEQYKAQLEGKRIEADIQTTQIEQYKAQLEAVATYAKFYKSQLEAAKIEADIEALELEGFRAEVAAHTATIQAKEAEWNAYRAAIYGEKAKQEMFATEVEAFRAETSAKVARLDGEKTRIEAQVQTERMKLENVNSQIDIYKANVSKQVALIEAQVGAFRARNEAYSNEIERAKAQAMINVEEARLSQEAAKFNMGEMNARFRTEGQILSEQIRTGVSAAANGAGAASSLAASALSQINTIAQIMGESEA